MSKAVYSKNSITAQGFLRTSFLLNRNLLSSRGFSNNAVSGTAAGRCVTQKRRLTKTCTLRAILASVCLVAGCGGGAGGTTAGKPLIESFSAMPATIEAGQSATLQWSVSDANSVSISGLTAAPGTSVTVIPATTTTYTLTAANLSGTSTMNAVVTVQAGAPLETATVNTASPGIQIAPTFLGFSHEWTSPASLMGMPGDTNPIYRQLVKNLMAYGGGPLIVRIGGNSTDQTGEPTSGIVAPMAQLYEDIGAKFTLGVNLGSDNVSLAADQARYYVANMPANSLLAIEIGNEPDLYQSNGDRPTTYTFTNYLSDFATWQTAIMPLLPTGVKLMGPSWSSTSSLSNLPAFLAQEKSNLSIVSQHYYAGDQCNGKTNPLDYLLIDSSATKGATAVASSVAATHADGLPFRMGEMNSIACGGETGISDAFGSALWAADTMFEFASVGVDGVNFHTGNGGAYALFVFNDTTTNGVTTFSVQSVRPEYYGLLFFQQAAPSLAKLLPVSATTSANLKTWATVDGKGTVRVALINKDESSEGVANITLPGYGAGTVTRMTASSYQATSGVTIGGQTFDGSTDGTAQGAAYGETVAAVNGVYSVALAPTSAAILTVDPN
jgi:Glycosyl hydrolase family 79 C-terminal beta domain